MPTPIEEIYNAYPRKIGRRLALEKIEKALNRVRQEVQHLADTSDAEIAAMMKNTVLIYAASPAGQRRQYTPFPSTWFHQSRYLDDPTEWFNVEDSKQDTLARRNSDALASVFGKLPNAHQSPFFAGTNSGGRKRLEAVSQTLLFGSD